MTMTIPSPTRTIEFRSCTVQIVPEIKAITTFKEDQSVSEFYPPVHDMQFVAAAHYAGYADPMQHGLEHDIVHAWLADYMEWPHSWSVWSAAHHPQISTSNKPWSQRVATEEHIVVHLQRFINTGRKDDEVGELDHVFSEDLRYQAYGLLKLLRPWVYFPPGSI